MMLYRVFGRACGLALGGAGLLCVSTADATTLRIVDWNIEADLNSNATGTFASNGSVTPLQTVLTGIGSVNLSDGGKLHAQAPDVIALQEVGASSGSTSTPDSVELSALVSSLNANFGANTYAFSTAADSTTGSTGGGPSALIYNQTTVSLVSASAIGTSSGSGAARAPMQYLLQPLGYGNAAQFYVDAVHSKSGTDSTSESRRGVEAQSIVSNTASLGSNSHVIVLGDFNPDGGTSDTGYTTFVGASGTSGPFTDVGNPSKNWTNSSSFANLLSEHSYDAQYRDDMQLVSTSATSGSGVAGVQYDSGSYTVFGNFGASTVYNGSLNSASNPGTFNGLTSTQTSTILAALAGTGGTSNSNNTAASDHIPVVSDYDIVGIAVPEPVSLSLLIFGLAGIVCRRRLEVGVARSQK